MKSHYYNGLLIISITCICIYKNRMIRTFTNSIKKKYMSNYARSEKMRLNQNQNIIKKLLDDIDQRLSINSILHLPKFEEFKNKFDQKKVEATNILSNSTNMNDNNTMKFTLNYYDILYDLLEHHGTNFNKFYNRKTYYSDFAKDKMSIIEQPTSYGKHLLETELSDPNDLIHLRAHCYYPIFIPIIPKFAMTKENYDENKPLIEDNIIHFIDGDYENFREVAYHDYGHYAVMKRMDQWIFGTNSNHPLELIKEWIHNKNQIMNDVNKLKNIDYTLWRSVSLYLFDLMHDRGYQFDLPIMLQQIETNKNLDNIYSKKNNWQFGHIPYYCDYESPKKAQNYLLNLIKKLL